MKDIPLELQKIFLSLESLESLNTWNIQEELKPSERIEGDWGKKLITERKSLFYNLNKGNLVANSQITDYDGSIISWKFDSFEVEYLKLRLEDTNNNWLKSRYAHLLWIETRHQKYASLAIDNYIKCINRLKAKEVGELSKILSAILFISKKSKIKLEVAKDAALTLLNDLQVYIKPKILETIIENNILTKKELKAIADDLPNWMNYEKPSEYFTNNYKLEVGARLYKLINLPMGKIYDLLATNEDLLINQREDESDFVRYSALGNKAIYLKRAGKVDESEEVLKEYNRLKQKVKLNRVGFELGIKENEMFNEYLNMKAKFILNLPTEKILAFFSINEEILVDPVENIEFTKKTFKNSIYQLFTTTVFDINTNFKTLKEQEKINHKVLKSYIITHNIKCYSLFLVVFIDGVLSGKLNYYKIFGYLEHHTWFGAKFKKAMVNDPIDEKTSWLSMLAPGIHNLFAQFELSVLMNTNKISNFILAIDSLTIKFEGALRDFILLSGGNTTTTKKGAPQEQNLEELLNNSTTAKYFTESDIELFKITYTQKGKNLRNNVAHSFLEYSDYNLQTAVLVFFCLLRLGKYTFNEKENKSA